MLGIRSKFICYNTHSGIFRHLQRAGAYFFGKEVLIVRSVNSERLLDLILDRQIRGKELARQAGLSTGVISNLLRRGARAQLVTIAKLAKALNVSPRELIEED